MDFIEIISKIPDTFWAAVLGGLISLLSVMLTNRHNLKQLTLKFDQDQKLRRADREHTMFQEIYLKASEVIADGQLVIMRFSDLRIPDSGVMIDADRKTAVIAQAQFVSDGPTREALLKVGSDIGSACLRLIAKRVPLGVLQNRIRFLDVKTDELLAKFQILNDQMIQVNLDGGDNRRMMLLQRNFDFNKSVFDEIVKEKDLAHEDFFNKQIEFVEECFEESLTVIDSSVRATCEMRRVLNLHTDKDNITRLAKKDAEAMRLAIKDFLINAKRIKQDLDNSPSW